MQVRCSAAPSCCKRCRAYDYFGGSRTIDVHIRRLRAKLGAEHEQMIGTVHNVGYTFVR
jgi:DNA-binding response OmpR family regulator